MEKFLSEDQQFDDMKAQVVRFKELADDIVYNSRKVIRLGMFELHCDELVRALSKRADSLCAKILIKMSKTNMDLNKGYVELTEFMPSAAANEEIQLTKKKIKKFRILILLQKE